MEYTQLSLFGKTSQEHSVPTKERTLGKFSRNLRACATIPFLSLDLQKSGSTLAPLWETAGQLPGVSWTPNTGECPSAAVESRLSWILEAIAPPKYYLTPKACNGILRRAERRGKPLPESLESALRYQAEHYAEIIERVKELWERYAA